MQLDRLPLVSVIITTKNSASSIEVCLKSIISQNYAEEKIEIIVVDNNSSDQTVAIAKKFTDKILFKGPERSVQRNVGIEKAQGKYILYLDSDMSLSDKVISQCVRKCENEGFIALYIPERITGIGFWVKVRDFERGFYNTSCIDAVRFVRRENIYKIDGFDESLTGPEDWDFDRRIKTTGRTGIIQLPLYHNEGKFNFPRLLRKKKYYAKNFNKYLEKWGYADPIVKKQLGFRYRFWGVFTEKGKWKRLLRHPFLTLAMYFLRTTVGISYVILKLVHLKSNFFNE